MILSLSFLGIVAFSCFGAQALGGRIVVLGDVHGDVERIEVILRPAGVLDSENRWTGGDTTLIFTGDILDRGAQVRAVMDLIMRLEKESRKGGGQVITLLGNHEVMNIIGDLRYVVPEAYTTFADEKSEKKRQDAYREYLKLSETQAELRKLPQPVPTAEQEALWMKSHPPGYFEYREAFGPKGKYGRWLRDLPVVVQLDDVIFIHGGIHPTLGSLSIKELNRRATRELASYDAYMDYLSSKRIVKPFLELSELLESLRIYRQAVTGSATAAASDASPNSSFASLNEDQQKTVEVVDAALDLGNWLINHPDGPLWFRNYGMWVEDVGIPKVTQLLEGYGAKFFVVGHTILSEREVVSRMGGRVLMVDTLEPAALEIDGDQFTGLYVDGRGPVKPLQDSELAGAPPGEEMMQPDKPPL